MCDEHWENERVIATVDISHWHEGGAQAEAAAALVDEGLQHAGFILVTGHGIDPALAQNVRAAAREFFSLPDDVKRRRAEKVQLLREVENVADSFEFARAAEIITGPPPVPAPAS